MMDQAGRKLICGLRPLAKPKTQKSLLMKKRQRFLLALMAEPSFLQACRLTLRALYRPAIC